MLEVNIFNYCFEAFSSQYNATLNGIGLLLSVNTPNEHFVLRFNI